MLKYFTLAISVVISIGQLTPTDIIEPTVAFANQHTKGFGSHFIIDHGVMAIGSAHSSGTGPAVLTYEYNNVTGEYDLNPTIRNGIGTNDGWALGYGNGWLILGGGPNDKPTWYKYEGGAWVQKFQVTSFPTDCPAEITVQGYDDKMDVYIRQCRTVAMDKFGSRAIIVPQNGWARVYSKITDTNWAHEVDIRSLTFGYDNLFIHSAIFCGPDDTHILWGGQFNPTEVPVYTRSGTVWTKSQDISIPVSPNAAGEDTFVGYDIKCDMFNSSGTQAIIGVPNDESLTTNSDFIGSAHIIELIDGTWTVTATFRDGTSNGRFGARVAINNRWAAVAEPQWIKSGVSGTDHGRVHVYHKSEVDDQWNYIDYIEATSPITLDYFGRSLWIDDNGKIYIGGMRYEFNSLTYQGRVDTLQLQAPTQAPTPHPTPTPEPTPNPYITVGTAKVQYNVKNGAARQQVAQTTISDVKATYSDPSSIDVRVKSTETSYNSITTYQLVNNHTLYEESYAKARGCWPDCTATIVSVGGNRRLSDIHNRELQTDVIEIEITFDLSEQAYDDLVTSGNNLDDPTFLNELAGELGIHPDNITITIVDGEVILELSLLAEVSTEPTGQDSLNDLTSIQASLNNATLVLVEELGATEDSVTTVTLDLCFTRDCNGYGDPTAPGTDENGCTISTGACVCTNDRWGINCEAACECINGGTCINALCHCTYPYYGLRCNLDKSTDCNTCF